MKPTVNQDWPWEGGGPGIRVDVQLKDPFLTGSLPCLLLCIHAFSLPTGLCLLVPCSGTVLALKFIVNPQEEPGQFYMAGPD